MKTMLACLLLFVSGVAYAQDPSSHEGVIDGLDGQYKFIVIDDGTFPFALNVKVRDEKGREVNRYALKPGMKIRYEYSVGANGYNQVSTVTILND